MCYSAQIEADCRTHLRPFGASMSIKEFVGLFWHRRHVRHSIEIPRAMQAPFARPKTPQGWEIRKLINEFRTLQAGRFGPVIADQSARLAEAEPKLAAKATKTWAEHKRIATQKAPKKGGVLKRPVLCVYAQSPPKRSSVSQWLWRREHRCNHFHST